MRTERYDQVRHVLAAGADTVVGSLNGPPHATTDYVIVHGIGVASGYFRRLAPQLAQHGRVHVLELPGMGDTDTPKRRFDVTDFARVVVDVVAMLDLERPVLVGHSMGTQVVTEAALTGVRARAVVLAGPVTNRHERSAPLQGLRLLQDMTRESFEGVRITSLEYLKCGPRWYFTILPAMIRYPLLERVAALPCPVLVLRGESDPIAPLHWVRELADTAQYGTAHEVRDSAHIVTLADPPGVATTIAAFAAGGGRS